jgi:hypothetical protein
MWLEVRRGLSKLHRAHGFCDDLNKARIPAKTVPRWIELQFTRERTARFSGEMFQKSERRFGFA